MREAAPAALQSDPVWPGYLMSIIWFNARLSTCLTAKMPPLLAKSHSGFIGLKQLSICWIITKAFHQNTIQSAARDVFLPFCAFDLGSMNAMSPSSACNAYWAASRNDLKTINEFENGFSVPGLSFHSFKQCKQEAFLD